MPQSQIEPDQTIIRDRLAYDRTELANERTLLSYLRTSIALFASGGVLMKFFAEIVELRYSGIGLLVLGFFTAVFGAWRFIAMKKKLHQVLLKLTNC